MTKRIVICLSHSIEEWMQLDLLHSLGYEVVSLGGYIDPAHPHDPKRPALPDVPFYPELKVAIDEQMAETGIEAQVSLPELVLEWLGDEGVIIWHHRLERLFAQWPRVRNWMAATKGRVIWRSVGQSVVANEREAQPFRLSGLERVAYSPREVNIPDYSGHDAIIRFWGHQDDEPWVGDKRAVINISQHLRQREPYTNWTYWDSATRDLPRLPIGPGSEVIGGSGEVSYDEMRRALHEYRAFLFTGTQPASYTLGLIEALHAGIPTVSIGPTWMRIDYGGHTAAELFEGHELAPLGFDDPNETHHALRRLLVDDDYAVEVSRASRAAARLHFDRATVGRQWAEYLG